MNTLSRLLIIGALTTALFGCDKNNSGTRSEAPTAVNAPPTAARIVELSSERVGVVAASWLPATDDETPATLIRYQLHGSVEPGFTPGESTLKAEVTGQAAVIASTSWTLGALYEVKLVAIDQAGAISISAPMRIRVSDTPASLVAGFSARTLTSGEVIGSTDGILTLSTAAATPTLGQILVSSENEGFLRAVTALNGLNVQTRRVALNEVFTEIQLSSSFSFSSPPSQARASELTGTSSIFRSETASTQEISWPSNNLRLIETNPPGQSPGQARRLSTGSSTGRILAVSGPNIAVSAKLTDGGTGRYASMQVPDTVAIEAGTSGTFTFDAQIDRDATSGLFGSGVRVALALCGVEVIGVPVSLQSALVLESEPIDVGGETYPAARKTRFRLKVDATQLPAQAEPYGFRIRLFVDEAANRCIDFNNRLLLGWKETVSVDSRVVVANQPSFPQAESRLLTFSSGPTSTLSVENEVTFTFSPTLETNLAIEGGRLKSAQAMATGRAEVRQQLKIAATAAGQIDQTENLIGERKFIKVFVAGAVPVVVVGRFSVDVRLEGTTTGRIEATETVGFSLEDMRYGIRYDGSQWVGESSTRPVSTLRLSGDADARAEIKLTLLPRMSLSVFDVATARLVLAPAVIADAEIRGKVLAEAVNGALTVDAEGWLARGSLDAEVNAYLMADASALDFQLLVWPEGAIPADYKTFQQFKAVERTKILGIPEVTASVDLAARHPTDSRAVLVRGVANNVPNPFFSLGGPTAFIEWTAWTEPRVVAANDEGYTLLDSTAGLEPGDRWVRFTRLGTYTVRLRGHSSLGPWARQIAEASVDLTDANLNQIPDYWESRYGLTGSGSEIAEGDPDGDGFSNLVEWQMGTDPRQGTDQLTFTVVPLDVTVEAGQLATFTASLSGQTGNLSLQWLRDGREIPGATSSTYTTAATSSSDDGASFSVRATSGGQTLLSRSALLTVLTPAVAASTGLYRVSVGETSSCAIKSLGEVFCWGRNLAGQLGNGTTVDSAVPVQVVGINDAVSVIVGLAHACALRANGVVVCWGSNVFLSLGTAQLLPGFVSLVPRVVEGLPPVRAIAYGISSENFVSPCAIAVSGSVYCWGGGYIPPGVIGEQPTFFQSAPIVRGSLQIDGGYGISADGVAFSRLSFGGVPLPITGSAITISSHSDNVCVLLSNQQLQCRGYNLSGELGRGFSGPALEDFAPVRLSESVQLSASDVNVSADHVCAVNTSRQVICWGNNRFGQLGNGSTENTNLAPPVGLLGNVSALGYAKNNKHNCAMQASGAVWCWGQNSTGQLGDGTTSSRLSPVRVVGF